MKIWKCATCGGGVRAPARMRPDDVRLYCLVCSAASGRLQKRICPAAEKARARKARAATKRRDQRKEDRRKKKVEAAAAKKARHTVGQIDLDEELSRIGRAAGWRSLPELEVSNRKTWNRLGTAFSGRRIILYRCWFEENHARAVGVLLHECAHVWLAGEGVPSHGRAFLSSMCELAELAYGVKVPDEIKAKGWRPAEEWITEAVAGRWSGVVGLRSEAFTGRTR